MKNCPFCAEEIQNNALKCRFCKEFLPKSESPSGVTEPKPKIDKKKGLFEKKGDGSRPPKSVGALKAPKAPEPRKQFSQDVRYVQVAIGMLLILGFLGAVATYKETGRGKAPFNIIQLIIFYYLLKHRSENARQWLLGLLLLGATFASAVQINKGDFFTAIFVFLAMIPSMLLISGESKTKRLYLAITIFSLTSAFMMLGILA